MEQELSLETIGNINSGNLGMEFNEALARAVKDSETRRHIKKARKVTLTVEIRPVPDDVGIRYATTTRVRANIPDSEKFDTCKMGPNGRLLFDDETGDIDQAGLDQEEKRTTKRKRAG